MTGSNNNRALQVLAVGRWHVEAYVLIGRVCRVVLVIGAATVGACSLPPQQLLLPVTSPGTFSEKTPQSGAPLAKVSRNEEQSEVLGTGQMTGRPARRSNVSAGKEGVTLEITGASVAEAAKSILGDVLGVPYTISDKVKGSISIQSSKAIPKDSLLEVFEDVLRGEGAAIVVVNGTYRILPMSEAVASAPLEGADRKYRRTAGVTAQVVPLQYVSAGEMERILKSIAPNAKLLRTDTERNLLVVAGTRTELDAIADAVSIFDVDWMRGMSFGIYPLESADVEAVAQELDSLFANDRDSPTKGIVRIIPNRRLKSILVISSRPEYLRRAKVLLRRLDTATRATVKQVFIYRARSRPVSELARLLQRIYGGQQDSPKVRAKAPFGQPDPLLGPDLGGKLGKGRGTPLSTLSTPASPEPPPAEQELPDTPIKSVQSDGGSHDDRLAGISVVEDEPNNALAITATAREYARVLQVLERLDVAPNQVLIEATIAEVRLNDELKMGVRWFFEAGNSKLRFSDLGTGDVASAFPGFSHFFNVKNIKVVLNALSSVTDLNIISSPTLMVLDNKKATLQVGNEVPIVTQSAVAVASSDAPFVNAITYRNTGIVLNITPRVGERGRVVLEVEQEASDVVVVPGETSGPSGIKSPTIQQRRIRTTVAVNDGEGIVLGGLIQDRAEKGRDQVPLIGEVPLLGSLFKNKDDKIDRTELLIAITPRVIRDSGHLRGITEEFRDKLNLSTRPQRLGPPDRKEQLSRVLR